MSVVERARGVRADQRLAAQDAVLIGERESHGVDVTALAPANRMTAMACAALGVSRATVQRRRAVLAAPAAVRHPRARPARALTIPQQQAVLDLLHAPGFVDQAPAEVYATLLDQGIYHCSIRTMYRILEQHA